MSKFQAIVLGIFVFAIVAGVAAFALYRGGSNNNSLSDVVIWGTFPAQTIENYIADINNKSARSLSVSYVEKKPAQFNQDFVNALARGRGPDAILVPADMILQVQDKLMLIPYSAISQRDFLDSYVSEAGIYLTQDGLLAIPFTVDPLVMYWNRDMFNAAGIPAYPKFWDEFIGDENTEGMNSKLTVKDANGNIRKSALAMGDFTNITNAREILGTLLLQLGNPITVNSVNGPVSTLKTNSMSSAIPAIEFFSQFADPSDPDYSWNRGQQKDKTMFLAGNLATYFGFASELSDIREKNPNLDFDVAPIPQIRQGGKVATYGKMYGFSIVLNSADPNSAYQLISILATDPNLSNLANMMYLPTVLLTNNQKATDPYIDSFNKAALISKTWLDADPEKSKKIMSDMIQSIISGQLPVNRAIQNAGEEYDKVLMQATQ